MPTGGNNTRDDHEGENRLKLPTLPPVIFGIPMVLGALVHGYVWTGRIIGFRFGLPVGVFLIAVGLWLMFWTWRVMKSHGEHPEPTQATETLVTSGPFKRTRNPIYAGFMLTSKFC